MIGMDIKRAVGETRTRDPRLGKPMLYQLSYYRTQHLYGNTALLPAKVNHYRVIINTPISIPVPLALGCISQGHYPRALDRTRLVRR